MTGHGVGVCLILAGSACSIGCSDASVELRVTPGQHPTFAWTPNITVHDVTVSAYESGAIAWVAFTPDNANGINSPVTYGITPPGARIHANRIETLQVGLKYRVVLSRPNSEGGLNPVAEATFVP
jgi:hypothetical protein